MQSVSLRLTRASGSVQTAPSVFSRILSRLALMRSRRDLSALDPHQLADIGLSHAQADAEAGRPIWDAPAYWTR